MKERPDWPSRWRMVSSVMIVTFAIVGCGTTSDVKHRGQLLPLFVDVGLTTSEDHPELTVLACRTGTVQVDWLVLPPNVEISDDLSDMPFLDRFGRYRFRLTEFRSSGSQITHLQVAASGTTGDQIVDPARLAQIDADLAGGRLVVRVAIRFGSTGFRAKMVRVPTLPWPPAPGIRPADGFESEVLTARQLEQRC